MKSTSGRNPVFVDSTGRRHRTIRRAGAFLAVPATAYVVLLVSSLLGGPTVNTPLVPLPAAPERLSKARPVVTPTPVPTVEATSYVKTVEPTEETPAQVPTQLPTPTPAMPVTTAPVTPGKPTTPTEAPTGTHTPTSTPRRGKPTAPPGRTKSPSKP